MKKDDIAFKVIVVTILSWILFELHEIRTGMPYFDNFGISETLKKISKDVDLLERRASGRGQPPPDLSFR